MKILLQRSVFSVLFFLALGVNAQDNIVKIEGRVISKEGDVAATHVSNITRNRGTITDINGFFNIKAQLNDTLVFSAVQFKKKAIVVSLDILENKSLEIFLEQALTQLNEVVVTPYNLTGDLNRDAKNIKVKPIVTTSTLGLPNAYVKPKTKNERRLAEADGGKFIEGASYKLDSTFNPMIVINLHKILNRITGRTRILKKYVAIDKEIVLLNTVKRSYHDSIYQQELKIPESRINDFINFCEVDSTYSEVAASKDVLRLWEFLERNSPIYRQNNGLD